PDAKTGAIIPAHHVLQEKVLDIGHAALHGINREEQAESRKKACREARRLIQQGGVMIDEKKVAAIDETVSAEALAAGVKIRKGKKVFHKVTL
ncbi:MAG: hypothetical protein IK036_01050, partial [Clostridia bacterium]|nr:hypothetical protein [Clostridia bacterium]